MFQRLGVLPRVALTVGAASGGGLVGCLVQPVCTQSLDCPSGEICLANGLCGVLGAAREDCAVDSDCGAGFECTGGECELAATNEDSQPDAGRSLPRLQCPEEMVAVASSFCVDRWEASRSDATEFDEGSEETVAKSRAGVMPWLVADNEAASAACRAAGKQLCTAAQWRLACEGLAGSVYSYGDEYSAETCNGLDTFGRAAFRLEPSGSFPHCVSEWGAYDMNGNVWEHVREGDGTTVRGGAFNCNDSATLHRCDYVPTTWIPSALGFRCCQESR